MSPGNNPERSSETATSSPMQQHPLPPHLGVNEVGGIPLYRAVVRAEPPRFLFPNLMSVVCLKAAVKRQPCRLRLQAGSRLNRCGLLFRWPFAIAPAVQPIGVLGRRARQIPVRYLGCQPQSHNQKTQAKQVRHAGDYTPNHAAGQDENLRHVQNPFLHGRRNCRTWLTP